MRISVWRLWPGSEKQQMPDGDGPEFCDVKSVYAHESVDGVFVRKDFAERAVTQKK